MRSRLLPGLALSCSLLVLVACRRDEPRTYTISKESSSGAAPAPASGSAQAGGAATAAGPAMSAADADAAMRNTAVPTATGPALAWDTPAAWTPGPERPMRKATLLIPGASGGPGAELAVTAFPGDVGGKLANVNRWRQQLGLPPVAESELGSVLQHLDVGPLHIDVVELVGPAAPPAAPQRVLGAMVPYAGSTWFFKLTGPDALVAGQRETFLTFVRSLRPQG